MFHRIVLIGLAEAPLAPEVTWSPQRRLILISCLRALKPWVRV